MIYKYKCKIVANKNQLEDVGVSYDVTGLIGHITKEYHTGFYKIELYEYQLNEFIKKNIDFDLPKSFVKIYPFDLKHIKVFVDMDGVLCDYSGGYQKALNGNPEIKYPQSQYGFFEGLEVIPNKFKYLSRFFDVRILSSPSVMNPLSYTEKRLWVENHLGMDAAMTMILAPDKSVVGSEIDYLIDDYAYHVRSKQQDFKGNLIHYGSIRYPDWSAVTEYFIKQYDLKFLENIN